MNNTILNRSFVAVTPSGAIAACAAAVRPRAAALGAVAAALLLLPLALPGTALAAITVDATSGNSGFQGGPISTKTILFGGANFPFTPGVNGMLVVTISGEVNPTTIGITYGGVPMSAAVVTNGTGGAGNGYAGIFYLPSPAAGGSPLVVTMTGAGNRYGVYAVYATGVDQGAPQATNSARALSVASPVPLQTADITPSAGALVVTAFGSSANSASAHNSSIYTNSPSGPLDPQVNPPNTTGAASVSALNYAVVPDATPVNGYGFWSGVTPNENLCVVIASFAPGGAAIFDHFAVTASSPQTVGAAFDVTITGQNSDNTTVNNSITTVSVSSPASTMEFDWNGDGTYGDNSGTLVAGVKTIKARNKKAETTTIGASGGGGFTTTPPDITTTAGAFTKLQILAPGETAAPATATGKTGTPTVQAATTPFNVTVNAVDQYWNVADTVSDTVGITSTDGTAALPADAALFFGTGTFAFTFNAAGNFTVTATDVTDASKTANTTPAITVQGISMVWVGNWVDNLWNTTSLNWFNPSFETVAFTNINNRATFDDTGSTTPSVNIVGTMLPDSITVNSANSYTFGSTSGGSIGGTSGLTKNGAGTLTLETANTFTGITLLSGGTLVLNTNLALQNSPLQLTSVAAPVNLGAGITNLVLGGLIKTGSENPITGFITVGYNDLTSLTLNVAAGRTASYSDIINNTTNIGSTGLKLIKTGLGWQGLTAANGFTGGLEIWNGTLAINATFGGRIQAVNTLTLGSGANSGTFELGSASGPNPGQTFAGLTTSGTGTSNRVVGVATGNSSFTVDSTNDWTYAGSFGGPGVNQNNLNVTKSGSGKLTLLSPSTHVGANTVNGGTLLVNNTTGSSTGSGAVAVNNATLGGTGTISGAVTVNANGTLAPGASIGTLTLGVPPTLNGTVVMELNTTQSPSNDVLNVTSGTLTAGGKLVVTNLPGSTLALGNSFKLFSAAVSGTFTSIVYPDAPSGTVWTNELAENGTIALVTAPAPSPTNITFSVSGGNLILDWPAGQGWQLQSQTNTLAVGISTNWVNVPDAVPPVTNAVAPANGSVFYRLVYP